MCKKLSFIPLIVISIVLFVVSVVCFLFMFTDTIKDLGISSLVDNSKTEEYLESILLPTEEKLLSKSRKCNAYLHDADATEFVPSGNKKRTFFTFILLLNQF